MPEWDGKYAGLGYGGIARCPLAAVGVLRGRTCPCAGRGLGPTICATRPLPTPGPLRPLLEAELEQAEALVWAAIGV